MAPRKRNALKGDVSCVLCGAAGQGIQTIENILPPLMKLSGYHVFATKEYMSRVRGGSNSTEIRIASRRVSAYVDRMDILVPLDPDAIPHVKKRISAKTLIIGDRARLGVAEEMIDVPFSTIAKEIGGAIYENIVAVGVMTGIFLLDLEEVSRFIESYFGKKSDEIVRNNIQALRRGYERGAELVRSGRITVEIGRGKGVSEEILLNGAEAMGMGAIAGGCNFITAYPMTPSTGVFTFLAQHGDAFGIVAEQAEDEIAAINMQLGAWYAGARAMSTTSGGGFALMVEGISLAGMIESPAVVSLGQRPGPATGLPTRTEQGDLELALYAGHGEFPRVVYAPGTLSDAFSLMQRAFDVADRYQVPVFVLSDQNLVDSLANVPPFVVPARKTMTSIVRTGAGYKRYSFTKSGISPRGIPGYGEGLVGVDSDEHDEEGHITEDLGVRNRMVEKRLRKHSLLAKDVVAPELIGKRRYRTLVVGWGSTCGAIREALEAIGDDSISFLYVKQVYPLGAAIARYARRAERTIVVENNATGQLAKLLKLHLGVDVARRILKYSGMPFSVEELTRKISKEARR